MRDDVKRESCARTKADGKIIDSEYAEPERKPKGGIDNFYRLQDLQLGSMTPVVRHKDNSPTSSDRLFSARHGPTSRTLKFDPQPRTHTY
jgi:hypothetical protein